MITWARPPRVRYWTNWQDASQVRALEHIFIPIVKQIGSNNRIDDYMRKTSERITNQHISLMHPKITKIRSESKQWVFYQIQTQTLESMSMNWRDRYTDQRMVTVINTAWEKLNIEELGCPLTIPWWSESSFTGYTIFDFLVYNDKSNPKT